MNYDALIVGAGVAGSACAILLRQLGLNVKLLEKGPAEGHYKKLCTHFLQPVAVPVLHRLGLAALCDTPHGVRTRAVFVTPAGLIDPQRGYGAEGEGYAVNLERAVLDPALRRQAVVSGVDMAYGERVTRLERQGEGWEVRTEGRRGEHSYRTRLLIAADGRSSILARLLGNEGQEHANQRATFFAYCSGIPAPEGQRSIFAHKQNGMAFLYPLVNQRTLLSAYIDKTTAKAWQQEGNRHQRLARFFDDIESVPSTADVQFETPVYGYNDYPNLMRLPVFEGVPFIGDAALSLDPMSGVGCSFALLAAAMLVDAVQNSLDRQDTRPEPVLEHYSAAFDAYFPGHARGIIADSLVSKDLPAQEALYRTIVDDAGLQRQYLDLTARLISPSAFQNAYLLGKLRQRSSQADRGLYASA